MNTLSTSAALTRITQPDAESAWATLVERHGPDVWRLIASRQWDIHVAEDAYQEFWLTLPQAAKRFVAAGDAGDAKAKSWLLAVAYRTAVDVHRRRKPAQALTQEVPSTTEHAMEEQDDREHQLARVRAALDQMPESYRQPVLLHLVGGLSYEDLAAEMRCTVNNARVKVHRGLTRLRELMGVGSGELSERTLAGLLVPPFLLAPPPAPALSVAVATPALPTAAAATGKLSFITAVAKAPVLAGAIATAVTATAVTATVVYHPTHPQETPMPLPRPVAAAVLATAVVAGGSAPAAGAVLDAFERADAEMLSIDSQKALLSIVPAPAGLGSGSALRIGWPQTHGTFIDCYYAKMIDAPAVTADGAAVATIKLWMEAYSGADKIAIRFVDARFETWQWGLDLPNQGQAGWRTLTIPLVPGANTGHWGPDGTVDGVIDFPLQLNGYAIQFTAPDVPAGSVLLDDVSVGPAAAAAAAAAATTTTTTTNH
jgi:RNA polymerase sigma factor (sigma-70 family)